MRSTSQSAKGIRTPSVNSAGQHTVGQPRISKTAPAGKSRTGASDTAASHKKTVKHPKPSDRLNPKTIDPFFQQSKQKSAFATAYVNGDIPCSLVHGNVRHKLAWRIPLNEVEFEQVLPLLANGLCETKHPYNFVAKNGFVELLAVRDAKTKVVPLLAHLVQPLKQSLLHKDDAVFQGGVEALTSLSLCVGQTLNTHLKYLLVPLSKRMMKRNCRDTVSSTLTVLEREGGKEALSMIKAAIPTYSSIS